MLGEKGEVGVLEPAGEAGTEPEPAEMAEVVLRRVMLRVMGVSLGGVTVEGGAEDLAAEKELYFRSLPRPVSGAGPASVSSQSLWRNPMMLLLFVDDDDDDDAFFFFFFCNNRNRWS